MSSYKAVTAYFPNKQLLPFGFAEQYYIHFCTPRLDIYTLQSGTY